MVFKPNILQASAISTLITTLRSNAPLKSHEMTDVVVDPQNDDVQELLDHMTEEERHASVNLIEKAFQHLAADLENAFPGVHDARDGEMGYRLSAPQFKSKIQPAWNAAYFQCIDSLDPSLRTEVSKMATNGFVGVVGDAYCEQMETTWNKVVNIVEAQGMRRE